MIAKSPLARQAADSRRLTDGDLGVVALTAVLTECRHLGADPALPIDDIIREFGLILWDDYYARSVRLRGGTVK